VETQAAPRPGRPEKYPLAELRKLAAERQLSLRTVTNEWLGEFAAKALAGIPETFWFADAPGVMAELGHFSSGDRIRASAEWLRRQGEMPVKVACRALRERRLGRAPEPEIALEPEAEPVSEPDPGTEGEPTSATSEDFLSALCEWLNGWNASRAGVPGSEQARLLERTAAAIRRRRC
jgi:hypothetical protein